MKDEFINYLKSININTDPLINRIKVIHSDCIFLSGLEPEDIFVDEYIDSESARKYTCVNFFHPRYFFAAENFITKNNYFIHSYPAHIIKIKITKESYDFENPQPKSRLNIDYAVTELQGAALSATQQNCEALKHIYQKYILPNLQIHQ